MLNSTADVINRDTRNLINEGCLDGGSTPPRSTIINV